ncbi:MAG: hypothetical protein WKG01_41755 [Kofleriaceae bacterium]
MVRALGLRPHPADHAMRERRAHRDARLIGRRGEPAELARPDLRARTVHHQRPRAADQVERDREADLVAVACHQRLGTDEPALLVRGESQHDRVVGRRRGEHARELDQDPDRGRIVDRAGAALDGVVVRHHEQRLAATRAEPHQQIRIGRRHAARRAIGLAHHLDRRQIHRADRHALDGDRRSETGDDVVGGRA